MKLIKKFSLALMLGVILFSSCKKETAPQLNAIPSNATFVVTLEVQNMIKKGGLNNLSDYKLFDKVKEEMANMDSSVKGFIDEFLKNPKSSGLDFEKIYVYGVKDSNGFYCAINFKMNNQGTFEKKMTELYKSQEKTLPEIKDLDGCKVVTEDGNATAWNNDYMQIYWGDVKALDFKALFNLPADKNILSVADFVAFQKEPHDVGLWMAYGELMNMIGQMSTQFEMPAYLKEFEGTFVHAYLNFDNGEIKAMSRMTPESKVKDFFKKYPILKENFNAALLEDFPDKSYLLAKVSFNWAEYLKLLTEGMAQMSQAPGMDVYEQILNNPTTKTLFEIIDGDAVFSLYNFAQGPLPIPLAGLSFTIKEAGDFDRLLTLFPQDMLKKAGDYYMIASNGIGIYVGNKDKRVLITDDAEAIASFVGKGQSSNLKNNPLAAELKKSPGLFYMNLDLETYPENLRAMLKGNLPPQAQVGLAMLAPLKDMSYYVNEKNEVLFSLKFKDSKQNSLKTFLKMIDDTASKQGF